MIYLIQMRTFFTARIYTELVKPFRREVPERRSTKCIQ